MNLDPITPYQAMKNLETIQKQYEELLDKVKKLTELIEQLQTLAPQSEGDDNDSME